MKNQHTCMQSHVDIEHTPFRKIIFLFVLILIPLMSFGQKKDKENWKKVTICHNGQTIEINESALKAHLKHGDALGPCESGIVYDGIVTPYLPLVEKVEDPIGYELTALNEMFVETGSAASNDIFLVSRGTEVLIEIIALEGKNQDVIDLLSGDPYFLDEYIDNDYNLNPQVITVLFPIEKLPDLNSSPWTGISKSARPVYAAITNSGVITSLGDYAQQSDIVRNAFNIYGENIKVGVLSDSYNSLGRDAALADVKNGDLPGPENTDGHTTAVQILKDHPNNIGSQLFVRDEGRAMLQIIHDIAPEAQLAFRTGFITALDMADGIYALQTAGCDIIVDDITYPNEPFFKDGVIAKAVDKVTNEGVMYFTSAGNFGNNSYSGQFNPDQSNPPNHDFNFGNGTVDIKQKIRFGKGLYRIVLQWEDDFYSLGETENGGCLNDLDIYLLNMDGDTLVNNNSNEFGNDPVEVMYFNVDSGFVQADIVITRASGEDNVNFKYVIFQGNDVKFEEYEQGTSTITGHANVEDAVTVGAILYSNTPVYDSIPTIASFSSHGGTFVYGIERTKPDIVAPNGVNTTVNLDGFNIDLDELPNFFGTSASAPHAAGVAALLINANSVYGESVNVKEIIFTTAIDMGEPDYDMITGNGFIQADDALMSFAAPIPLLSKLVVPIGVNPGIEQFDVQVIGDNLLETTEIQLDGQPLSSVFVSSHEIVATVPEFIGDPPLFALNPSITSSGLDGGISDSLFFLREPKKIVIVEADKKIKKYGENLPEFTATILVDSIPLLESGYSLADLGLDNLTFTSTATLSSIAGVPCIIKPVDNTAGLDSTFQNQFEYQFYNGNLIIEKLPVTITPNDLSFTYGDKIEGITFQYSFDNTNMDENGAEQLQEILEQDHSSTFIGSDSIALVDRGRLLVNRGRLLVNGTGWLAGERTLVDRGRLLVNGNVAYDIDATLLEDYQENPNGTLTDRGRLLVNAKSLVDGTAVIADRGRLLVNDGSLINGVDSSDIYADIAIIIDENDSVISSLYSINLISGLDVTGETPHYIVPGAFISPAVENFEVTYELGNLEITPAALHWIVDDKEFVLGDPLPEFTSTISGYKYKDVDSIVFSLITYTPTEVNAVGIYDIVPEYELYEPSNYFIEPDPIMAGALTVLNLENGKVAFVSNRDGNYEIYTMNSDGSNQRRLTFNTAIDADPAWNRTGNLIAYREQSTASIGIMDDRGNKIRNISSGTPTNPGWSRDGSMIVFSKGGNIYTINVDGTNEIQLTSGEEFEGFPDFSPDLSKIIYERDDDIWVMNVDGTDQKPFISDSHFMTHPRYSSDGNQIVFNYGSDIATINTDSTGFNHLYDPVYIASDVYPDWAPDDSRLVMHVYYGNNDIWTLNPDGSGSMQLTANSASDTQPDWGIAPNDVYIPDPNFEQALIDLGIDSDGTINQRILQSDALSVTSLNVTDPPNNLNLPNVDVEITDLTGIEAFVNLTFLSCRLNELENLDVTKNILLTELRCDGNNLDNLDVSQNTDLAVLWCGFNELTDIDLSNNTLLRTLHCNNNLLINLDLSQNTELVTLWCSINPNLGNLDVSQNVLLEGLSCTANGLDNLDLSTNTALLGLNCYWNNLATLDVSNSPNLSILRCYHNQLTYLDVRNGNNSNITIFDATENDLSCINVDNENFDFSEWEVDANVIFRNNCGAFVTIPDNNFEQALIDLGIDSDGIVNQMLLTIDAESVTGTLNVDSKNISDLTGIEAFTNITSLVCSNNQLTAVDVSNNVNLELLNIHNNELQSLDLSNNILLKSLFCETNQLLYLNLTNNTALETLFCPQNQLDSLILNTNLQLNWLVAWSNNLTELDVSNNTLLTGLFCSNNQISSLDIGNNQLIYRLNVGRNLLTSLDVSNNNAIEMLICDNNNLTTLNVSNLSSLTEFRSNSNDLTSLDVRNGNNNNFISFNASDNSLACISVDDEGDSHNGWETDAGVILSNDCSITHTGNRTISGRVTGDGSPLIGTNIIVKGTTFGTITNLNGDYFITVNGDDAILQVAMIGYLSTEVAVGNRSVVNIELGASMTMSSMMSGAIVDGNVTIYPNPVRDWLTIEFTDESVDLTKVSIEVYNEEPEFEPTIVMGSTMVYGFEVDFSSLNISNYYLHLYDGIELRIFRIVKE